MKRSLQRNDTFHHLSFVLFCCVSWSPWFRQKSADNGVLEYRKHILLLSKRLLMLWLNIWLILTVWKNLWERELSLKRDLGMKQNGTSKNTENIFFCCVLSVVLGDAQDGNVSMSVSKTSTINWCTWGAPASKWLHGSLFPLLRRSHSILDQIKARQGCSKTNFICFPTKSNVPKFVHIPCILKGCDHVTNALKVVNKEAVQSPC